MGFFSKKTNDVVSENGENIIYSKHYNGEIIERFYKRNGLIEGDYIFYHTKEERKGGKPQIKSVERYSSGKRIQQEIDLKSCESISNLSHLTKRFLMMEVSFGRNLNESMISLNDLEIDNLSRVIKDNELKNKESELDEIILFLKYRRNYLLFNFIEDTSTPVLKHLSGVLKYYLKIKELKFHNEILIHKHKSGLKFNTSEDYDGYPYLKMKIKSEWIVPPLFENLSDDKDTTDTLFEIDYDSFIRKLTSFNHPIIGLSQECLGEVTNQISHHVKNSKIQLELLLNKNSNISNLLDNEFSAFKNSISKIVNSCKISEDLLNQISDEIVFSLNEEKKLNEIKSITDLNTQSLRNTLKDIELVNNFQFTISDILDQEIKIENYNPVQKEFQETKINFFKSYKILIENKEYILSVLKIDYDFEDYDPIHIGMSEFIESEYHLWDYDIQEKNESLFHKLETIGSCLIDNSLFVDNFNIRPTNNNISLKDLIYEINGDSIRIMGRK